MLKQLKLEFNTAYREVGEAREALAKMAGKLEVAQVQNASLLVAVQKSITRYWLLWSAWFS
ncbi:hypothetical protein B738_23698 [Photorhabdus temperata subsp. temperata M1021]|uniref:Uncharacterized protein n=1 Tax=Photorhabdus temperata J3 TaxID=1389415 RepID=U7QVH4_PHOTE|nr:hypothetical protein B738_23698 [Photorhabdus temperata subsp. temperata M1021]ERT11115.1 hypothetical protein O185_21140 [Photorhabdus temperata J3]